MDRVALLWFAFGFSIGEQECEPDATQAASSRNTTGKLESLGGFLSCRETASCRSIINF